MILQNFPLGHTCSRTSANTRSQPIWARERFVVEPDNSQHLVSSDKDALHLRLAVSEESKDGWNLIFDSFFPNWKERRTLIFIYDSVRNGRSHVETRPLLENQASWDEAVAKKGKADRE